MPLGEFEIIAKYFTSARHRKDVLLGVGDDAAVVEVPAGLKLVAAVDTINEGVHFPGGTAAADIGYRALAVNLSDMAAMGAAPRWFTLSLSLPGPDEAWLGEFASGLLELANDHDLELIGGDTVKGPLSISVQILGTVASDRWLTRSAGRAGDVIFVSGVPGEAAAGLRLLLDQDARAGTLGGKHLLGRFLRPEPRVELGAKIRTVAHAAMDISDGLLTDLRKLCTASGCGAHIDLEALPPSPPMRSLFDAGRVAAWQLGGGDDYELLFTVPSERLLEIEALLADQVRCTPIGRLIAGGGVQCCRQGEPVDVTAAGFDHFAS